MKIRLFFISMVALLFIAAGCRKVEYAYPAVYGKIYCTNADPKVGDTVILKVEVPYAGNRIYHADYTWNSSGEFKQTVRVTADNSKNLDETPTFKWVFKKAGSYTVTLSARFKYSMADEGGSMIGGASASGTIRIK